MPFNHASTLDIFIVQATLPDHGVPVAKREFIRVPLIGWTVYLLDFVLLDRKDRRRAAASLSRAAARITRERLSVVIAPEGTRSHTGELGPFKLGPMHLAVASHAPLVPMIIHGSARAMPHGQLRDERDALLVEALVRSGDVPGARTRAAMLEQRAPQSPQSARVRALLRDAP